MRIGIMGGTFDPIHNGHLMLGEYAYRKFDLDEVWFMPNGNPPHKQDVSIRRMTDHRIRMTELAIEDIPYFKLCTYETDRTEKSYTYETMECFHERYPEHEFYFIIGADSLLALDSWKCPQRLLQLVTILAAYRDDMDTPEEMDSRIRYLNRKYHGDIRLLRTPVVSVSSRDIRRRIREGLSYDYLMPDKTAEYIKQYHIYQGE